MEKTFACDECDKKFATDYRLRYHKKAHKDPLVCEHCNRTFELRALFRVHMQKHTGTLPFTCDKCGKGFGIKSLYLDHQKRHNRELTHFCSVCQKGYPTYDGLKYHMKRHKGETNHFCKYCNMGFDTNRACRDHERSHIPEMSSANQYCIECKEEFPASQFKYHMKIHGPNKYFCKYCQLGFKTHRVMIEHEMIHVASEKTHNNDDQFSTTSFPQVQVPMITVDNLPPASSIVPLLVDESFSSYMTL